MRNFTAQSALSALAMTLSMSFAGAVSAQDEVTFHKDIEPILQRSCQNCHRDGGAGPMPLVTYEEVAPFAGLIEYKTGLRDRAGAMPPWYMEKNIGIQEYKDDPFSERRRNRCYFYLGAQRHAKRRHCRRT